MGLKRGTRSLSLDEHVRDHIATDHITGVLIYNSQASDDSCTDVEDRKRRGEGGQRAQWGDQAEVGFIMSVSE